VFETGRRALEDPSSELLLNPYVAELYLGGKAAATPQKAAVES